MHYDFFDVLARNLYYNDIMHMKSTFLMMLDFVYSNISINSFLNNVCILTHIIMRSRTSHNMYVTDILLNYKKNETDASASNNALLNSDDDDEYKTSQLSLEASYFVLEQQLSVAGYVLYNNVCDFANIKTVIEFSYMS